MELSNTFKYTLLALLELTKSYKGGEYLQIKEIATLQHIPHRYLEQLLGVLRRGGLIEGIRGCKGGYVLAREPQKITLLDAFNCAQKLDANISKENTILKAVEINVVEELWQEACQSAYSILQQYTLQDLYERRINQEQLGLMYYI